MIFFDYSEIMKFLRDLFKIGKLYGSLLQGEEPTS